jgi:hypothetical protein
MSDGLNHLLLVSTALERHRPVPMEAGDWLAGAVNRWLTGEVPTLDEAMGLRPPAGSRRPATRLRLAARDAALRDALAFYSHMSRAAAAQRVATLLARYASTGWNRDRNARICPYGADSINSALWRAMKAGNGRAIGAEMVRKIGNEP